MTLYKVVAYRTKAACRALELPESFCYHTMVWGPWKRRMIAVRKERELREHRVQTIDRDGNVTDRGPSFYHVQIEVLEESE